jgi:hypothetical protein
VPLREHDQPAFIASLHRDDGAAAVVTDAKRHHQVPQFYLRQFADNSEMVTVVRLGATPRTFTTGIKNVAVEAHFYDVDWLARLLQ